MFTIRRTLTLGLGQVKWGAPEGVKSLSQLSKLDSMEAQKAALASANEADKKSILEAIKKLPTTNNEATKKWRENMISFIETNPVPKAPTALAQNAGVDTNKNLGVADKQQQENMGTVENTMNTKNAITTESSTAQARDVEAIQSTIAYKDNEPLDLQYDDTGKMKTDSVINLLADLDATSWVERTNRGWFRRTFFGGGDQKEVLGEQQVKNLLFVSTWGDQNKLNEIYKRISGDKSDIVITTANKANRPEGSQAFNSRYDFDRATQRKIEQFQRNLIEQADVMATMSGIFLGDSDARTGARAVLEGKTDMLQVALQNSNNIDKFKKTLAENGTLERDPNFLEKVASVLLRMGISAGVAIASGGVLGGYIEQGKLDIKDGKVKKDGLNLTAKTGIGGESGSVAASLDLAWVRLEANWNDPAMRISNRVALIQDAEAGQKVAVSGQLVDKINQQAKEKAGSDVSEKEQKKLDMIADLGKSYLAGQGKLATLPESPAKNDALAHNTLVYLSKVEALNGFTLKGIFASANLSGFMVGLSGSAVDTSATSQGLKVGAGSIESQVLGGTSLTEEQFQTKLTELGITKNQDGTYVKDGKAFLVEGNASIPTGKKVQWTIEEIYTDRDKLVRAIPTLVDANVKFSAKLIRKNQEAINDYIQSNSKDVADFMLDLRHKNSGITNFEKQISDGKYSDAKGTLEALLKWNTSAVARELLKQNTSVSNNPSAQKAFFDLLLSNTSGWSDSRKIGANIEANKTWSIAEARKYFSRVAPAFAREYGIDANSVMKMFNDAMKAPSISTLGKHFSDGFTAMVAYSQLNKGQDFKKLDSVDHTNARIIGAPVKLTGSEATKIRNQLKSKITEADVTSFKADNPSIANKDLNEIKTLMVWGKVCAYLSFEEGAQCFNLGFAAEPGTVEGTRQTNDGTLNLGTTVGESQVNNLNLGVWGGVSWDKFKSNESPRHWKQSSVTDSNNGTWTPQTGTHTGATKVDTPPVADPKGILPSTNNSAATGAAGDLDPQINS